MTQYEHLDMLILEAVLRERNPLYWGPVNTEATRIGDNTGREPFRIIDGRIQALRKRGIIKHVAGKWLPT